MQELFFLIIFFILSTLFAILSLITSYICSYKNSYEEKSTVYECGMSPFGNAKIKFDMKYLNFAILFLIFDVASVFLFPFAVSFNNLEIGRASCRERV